jgi:serine/threonine-protein kinase
MVYTELGETGDLRPDEAYARAREAGAKALALDSGLGEAHCMLAYVKAVCDFDWVGAEQEFKRALELTPNSADTYDLYGRMCLAMERNDEGLAMERRAQELDPLAHRADVARALLRAGRYDEALAAARRATELDPHYARGHATLGWALLKKGMIEQGLGELETAVSLAPGHTQWLGQLGQAYGMVGNVARAREVLRQLEKLSRERFVSPYHMALVHTGLGEHDRAVDWLERAYEGRSGPVYSVKGSFLFTTLHGHPRFTALLKKMNLA